MAAKVIQLQNSDGSPSRWIGERELRDLKRAGAVTKISGRRDAFECYRLKSLPVPSGLHFTAAQITVSDEMALVGIHKVNEVWVERLIGFGLLAEGTPCPARGFLNS
jgi:hypothetical protein